MNEKRFRPQFNQMDTTEKQVLMENLAARYAMTFLGLHTFDRWGPVSYTHLDVYKRQVSGEPRRLAQLDDTGHGLQPACLLLRLG